MNAFGADVDPTVYRERMWPRLGGVKLAEIMDATWSVPDPCTFSGCRKPQEASSGLLASNRG